MGAGGAQDGSKTDAATEAETDIETKTETETESDTEIEIRDKSKQWFLRFLIERNLSVQIQNQAK